VKPKASNRKLTLLHVAIILGFGVLFRLLYQYTFKPGWSGDTGGYSIAFYLWLQRTYSFAERPPVYSLFLGLVQWLSGNAPRQDGMGLSSQYLVASLQSLFGLSASLLVYFSLRRLQFRPKIALIGGISFALIGAVCLFELLILTEVLSLFFVALGIWSFARGVQLLRASEGFAFQALLSGFSFSLAILTRPENLVFAFVVVFVVLVLSLRCRYLPSMRWAASPLVKLAVLMIVSAAPLVLCWMTWNLIGIGQFRINTITGATRTESVYNLFDRVDDPQDRIAGAILSRSYLYKNRNGNIYRHHVWVAMPYLFRGVEAGAIPVPIRDNLPRSPFWLGVRHWVSQRLRIQEQTILNGEIVRQPVELYDYLGALSGRLARKYPALYMRNVLNNFITDTFDHNYSPFSLTEMNDPHAPEGGNVVRSRALYPVTVWISRIEAPVLTASYLLLLGVVLLSPWLLLGRSAEHLLNDGVVVSLALAAFATIVCCCFVAAYYPEHGVPFFTVNVICAVWAATNWKRTLRAIYQTGIRRLALQLRNSRHADHAPTAQ
jgi:hypothetical protein